MKAMNYNHVAVITITLCTESVERITCYDPQYLKLLISSDERLLTHVWPIIILHFAVYTHGTISHHLWELDVPLM